jgi:hypothetical protein
LEKEMCESAEVLHVIAAGGSFLLQRAADSVGTVGMTESQFIVEFQSGLVILLGSVILCSGFVQLNVQPTLYGFSFRPRVAAWRWPIWRRHCPNSSLKILY